MAAGTMREAILADLVTTIGAITTGGGYNHSIGLATRVHQEPEKFSPSDLPAVVIIPAAETRSQEDASSGQFRSEFRVELWVTQEITRTDQEGAGLSTDFEELLEDLHTAIMVDETRGVAVGTGEVEETFLEEVTGLTYLGERTGRLQFVCVAKVIYRENRATP